MGAETSSVEKHVFLMTLVLNTHKLIAASSFDVFKPAFNFEFQAYAAGFGEGFITSKLIYMSWFNTMKDFCDGKGRDVLCKRIAQYLSKNTAWIEKKLSQNDKPKGVYWHQVDLFYRQLDGMTQGYMKAAQISGQVIPKEAIFWLNIFGDLEDLTTKFATKFNITDENGQLLGRKHGEGVLRH